MHFGLVSSKNSGVFEIAGVFADFKMNDFRQARLSGSGSHTNTLDKPTLNPSRLKRASMFVESLIVQFKGPPQQAPEALIRRTLADIDLPAYSVQVIL